MKWNSSKECLFELTPRFLKTKIAIFYLTKGFEDWTSVVRYACYHDISLSPLVASDCIWSKPWTLIHVSFLLVVVKSFLWILWIFITHWISLHDVKIHIAAMICWHIQTFKTIANVLPNVWDMRDWEINYCRF